MPPRCAITFAAGQLKKFSTRHEGFTDSNARRVALCTPISTKGRGSKSGVLSHASVAYSQLTPMPIEILYLRTSLLTRVGHITTWRTLGSPFDVPQLPSTLTVVTTCNVFRKSRGSQGRLDVLTRSEAKRNVADVRNGAKVRTREMAEQTEGQD